MRSLKPIAGDCMHAEACAVAASNSKCADDACWTAATDYKDAVEFGTAQPHCCAVCWISSVQPGRAVFVLSGDVFDCRCRYHCGKAGQMSDSQLWRCLTDKTAVGGSTFHRLQVFVPYITKPGVLFYVDQSASSISLGVSVCAGQLSALPASFVMMTLAAVSVC